MDEGLVPVFFAAVRRVEAVDEEWAVARLALADVLEKAVRGESGVRDVRRAGETLTMAGIETDARRARQILGDLCLRGVLTARADAPDTWHAVASAPA
ncbi:hypothetical protein AB0D35_26315 [Streptomyces sp. NPDC048301]|uniref:hypothetical protein n=1 Tax=unclassified Streptomyces TaxID=2593676 RepID=UPI0034241894